MTASSELDTAVTAWALDDLQAGGVWPGAGPIGLTHLASCPTTRVTSSDHEWVCDCAESWSGSHYWYVRAGMTCDHGAEVQWNRRPDIDELPAAVRAAVAADQVGFRCRHQPR